jgi:hypothetical protein
VARYLDGTDKVVVPPGRIRFALFPQSTMTAHHQSCPLRVSSRPVPAQFIDVAARNERLYAFRLLWAAPLRGAHSSRFRRATATLAVVGDIDRYRLRTRCGHGIEGYLKSCITHYCGLNF